MTHFHSPFRYPGGKRKLANFIKILYRSNSLLDGEYAEPYAGGAAVGLSLLYEEYVKRILINDIDKSVYSFWYAALNQTEELCKLINDVPVTMEEWERQKSIQGANNPDPLDLAVSTFFLNRSNRSGIISGGVIGGKKQTGKWKIAARFNKPELIKRIRKIGRYRTRIKLFNLDAEEFIKTVISNMDQRSLVYFDPPYYFKGQQKLYTNYYSEVDHERISHKIAGLTIPWVISYDNVEEIRALYGDYRSVSYDLNYSAQKRYRGQEVMFFSDQLDIPEEAEPARIRSRDLIH